MLKKIKIKKNIFGGLIIAVLCFFAYQSWGNATTSEDSQLISTKDASSVGDETLQLLSELRTLTLDEDIFSDKVFQSLEDFRMDLQAQPVGRNNPFALVGSDGEYVNVDVSEASNTVVPETSKTEVLEDSECEGENCSVEAPEELEELGE